KLLGGYAAFYNPLNMLRALKNNGSLLRRRRLGWQVAGQAALVWTALKMLPYIIRLMSKRFYWSGPPAVTEVPVRQARGSFARVPPGTLDLPARAPAKAA